MIQSTARLAAMKATPCGFGNLVFRPLFVSAQRRALSQIVRAQVTKPQPRALKPTLVTRTLTNLSTVPSRVSKRSNSAAATIANRPVDEGLPGYQKPSRVTIPIDGKNEEFSSVLLRDACPCPSCVHESTRQRLFCAADIPANVEARDVHLDIASETVSIKWRNDVLGFSDEHCTKFDIKSLENLSRTGSFSGSRGDVLPTQALWSKEPLPLKDYDYGSYMKDDEALFGLMNQLHTYGLAFVTNVPGTEEALATIATRIGPVKDTFYGYTWNVRSVPAAINAAYTSSDLGFHTDLLYFQNPPHVQLLHCVQSASTGGASVFADAYKAAADLFYTDRAAFDLLSTVPVNYHYDHPDSNVYRTTKPVIDLQPLRIGNTVYTKLDEYRNAWHNHSIQNGGSGWDDSMLINCMDKINWGPPFLAPFSAHQNSEEEGKSTLTVLNNKVDEWHEAASKFNALLQRSEYLYERKMNPGECVLFDNTRTLHSRRAFDMADVGKPRWLRGTYVDKDPFFSKLRVLQNRIK